MTGSAPRRSCTLAPALVLVAGVLGGCRDAAPDDPGAAEGVSGGATPAPAAISVPPPPDTVTSADGTWRVAWRTDPASIVLDELFAVEVTVRPADGEETTSGPAVDDLDLSIDARMPHHRHGMLVRPTVRRLGPGRFRAEGLLLHMPGYWEFHFDLVDAGAVERAQVAFEIDG